MGRAQRKQVPRSSHGDWTPAPDRPDPIGLLQEQDKGRVQELIPIKYGRMVASPFSFLRGSAVVMAADLATTPSTGLEVQLCGDAHLSNFGVFATPERNLVFDVNDFDETHPGPWEWDLKRLAASAVVAGRESGLSEKINRNLTVGIVEQAAFLSILLPCTTITIRFVQFKCEPVPDLIKRNVVELFHAEVARFLSFNFKP